MKFTSILAAILLFFNAAFAQKTEKHSRAKILLDHNHTINGLAVLGLAVDHGEHKKNNFFVSDFSITEIEQARKAGYEVEIVIDDVSKHYRDQNKKKESAKTTAVTCDNKPEIVTPSHFHLGSYGGYFTYTEMIEMLDSMRLLYPGLISARQAVGSFLTIQGRPIYWVRISDNPDVDQPLKPQMLTTSVHHAREPGSLSSNIYYLWYLLENYATDPHIKEIIDNTELYFIPCVNPDGYERNILTDPGGGGLWRKNMRDNLDGTFGVDLNRNYGITFAHDDIGSSPVSSTQTYRGTAAFSEPETQAMKWFAENHDFKLNINYHTYNNAFIYPWGHVPSLLTPDSNTFSSYGAFITEYNHYRYGTCDQTLSYVSNGGSDDWMYGETTTKNKIFAFTPEVGDDEFGFYAPSSNIINDCKANLIANIRTASLLLPYANVTSMDDKILVQPTGYLHYNIRRLGIPDGATFTVNILPLDSWLTVPATANTYSSLAMLQEVADSFSYSLSAATPNGQQVGYVLKTSNGLYDTYDTVRFFYGKSYNISTAGTSSLSDWTYSNWSVCTNHFHSAPSSIKSSPSCGNYIDGDVAYIELNTALDLSLSTEAWLRFFGRWGIESKYDYLSVQASIEGTGFWQTLCGEHTRPGTMYQLYHEPIYDAQQPDWVMERIDLGDFLGQKILLKFELVSDAANNYDGFYVDDLEVRSVQDSSILVRQPKAGTNGVYVYPNPSGDFISISASQPHESQPCYGAIYDCMGRVVINFSLDKPTVTLSVKALPAGVYSLKLTTGQTSLPVQKIIVNR
jgi:carboxypeptidase T